MMRILSKNSFPSAVDPDKVGQYDLLTYSGGGYFYDDVLEYRVWIKKAEEPRCFSFSTYKEARKFSKKTESAEPPLVLVRQKEYIAEPEPGVLKHVKQERITEWLPEWLHGTRGTANNIPNFIAKKHRQGRNYTSTFKALTKAPARQRLVKIGKDFIVDQIRGKIIDRGWKRYTKKWR